MGRIGFLSSMLAASTLPVGLLPCLAGDTSDWGNLSHIRPGEDVLVVRDKMKTVKGGFESFSADSIVVRFESVAVVIPKSEVVRVTLLERGRRLRNAAIGAAAGGAMGVLIGHLATSRWNGQREGVLALSAIVGIGGGAAVGVTTPGHPTVYRFPDRPDHHARAPRRLADHRLPLHHDRPRRRHRPRRGDAGTSNRLPGRQPVSSFQMTGSITPAARLAA